MRKIGILLLAIMFLFPLAVRAAVTRQDLSCDTLTGGGTDPWALDRFVTLGATQDDNADTGDYEALEDGDSCLIWDYTNQRILRYIFDIDSGQTENSPFYIKPDYTEAVGTPTEYTGDGRWVLLTVVALSFQTAQDDVADAWKGYEKSTNGSNYMGFIVPDAITNNILFRFTDTDPTADQVMLFAAPSAGESAQTWGDPILETELDTESKLEGQLTDVANVFTNNDTIPEANIHADLTRDNEWPSATGTFTNKTIDANGTGNVLSNIDEDNMLNGSDIVRDGIEFVIDGGGSAITTGEKGHLEIPYNCTIQRVTMMADQSGSIVVDIWVDTYVNFPPTDADSITASAPPTITTAQKSQDSTLTGWTTGLSAGSIIAYNVDSCTTITRVTVSLVVEK